VELTERPQPTSGTSLYGDEDDKSTYVFIGVLFVVVGCIISYVFALASFVFVRCAVYSETFCETIVCCLQTTLH
jgi:hypothetical protein